MPSSLFVSDDLEDMESAQKIDHHDNNRPEVKNSTSYYSSRRRRKSKRGLMGMGIREYLVKPHERKENDPFDYEQKFPHDKQYGELGSTARVWGIYLDECTAFDIETVEG
ncbi:hypothetical protein IW261DRAFT_1595206 [Armillaria novae-zelandiae]|uniref:Uncharacterized protein n=1 Tax=Armillaria novae-zelandiae TaxID=153914 RepID=A0AA39UEY7_9AGAR|nr:hypothetical protein IW261DRAFT_1595206 [Armillaria novae-zelandiae]